MTTTFPTAKRRSTGYDQREVDAFLARARAAYDADDEGGMTSDEIRHVSFGLKKGGYSTAYVDAALERLEDAFFLRERERAFEEAGKREWLSSARETAQVILNRLARPDGERFSRVSILSKGYRRSEVDALAERLIAYFEEGKPVKIDQVRTVAFSAQRGGYRESQVDLLLDSVVEVMLAVR